MRPRRQHENMGTPMGSLFVAWDQYGPEECAVVSLKAQLQEGQGRYGRPAPQSRERT